MRMNRAETSVFWKLIPLSGLTPYYTLKRAVPIAAKIELLWHNQLCLEKGLDAYIPYDWTSTEIYLSTVLGKNL